MDRTYRVLLQVPGFPQLAGATALARLGSQMQMLVLVLFVLERYRSAPLAGATVFLSLVPGLILSPLAGALLDRHRRMLLIRLDYAVAGSGLVIIATAARIDALPPAALLLITAVCSLTTPLSNSGTRSLFPVMVPQQLWDRANAVDSGLYVAAAIAGPGLAGVLVGLLGGEGALLGTAVVYALSIAALGWMTEPVIARHASGNLMRDAWDGLRYVLSNRALRGLAVATTVSNIGYGVINVGMPVLLLGALHQGSATVGVMWTLMGVGGLVSGIAAGRFDSTGRETWFIVAGGLLGATSVTLLTVAASGAGGVAMVVGAMLIFGLANGPFDIGLFSLRQRATEPHWMGRAFAVSMSINFIGMPIGSAIAGPLADRSLVVAFSLGIATDLIAVAAAMIMLRRPSREAALAVRSGGSDPAPSSPASSPPADAEDAGAVTAPSGAASSRDSSSP